VRATEEENMRLEELFLPTFPTHLTIAIATPDVEMHGFGSDSVLNKPLGPGTLETRSMVSDACRNVNVTASVMTSLKPRSA